MIYNALFSPQVQLKRIADIPIGKYLGVFLFLVPICIYFFYILHYAKNIPYLDDYDSIFGFIADYNHASSLPEKIKLVFSQHNDHRIGFMRTIVLLQYFITGSINFKYLILIGNLSIPGILIILWHSIKIEKYKIFYFTPALYLLFGFSYYEASLWAMVSLSGLPVVTFSLASIYFIGSKKNNHFLFACCFAALAVFTQGNGKIVLICGFFAFLLQKDFKKFIIWSALSITLLLLPQLFFTSTFKGYIPIQEILLSPKAHIFSLFSFLGTFFDGLKLSIGVGVLMVGYFILLVGIKYYNRNLILFNIFLFVILNAFAVGYGRPNIDFPSRYAIYSTVTLVVIYLTLIDLKELKRMKLAIPYIALMIIITQVYAYITDPMKLSYYTVTVKNYEKHLVLNHYFTKNLHRDQANKRLSLELNSLVEDPIVLDLQMKQFLERSNENTRLVRDEPVWWLEHVVRFSRQLKIANSAGIYNTETMLHE